MSVRYQVINKGRMWHIYDRASGKTVAFCSTYRRALALAQHKESAMRIALELAAA